MKKKTLQPKQEHRVNAKGSTKVAITRKDIHSLRGKFRGKELMKALMAAKKREREL